jgi:N-methylhydantoinase A
MRYVGQEHTLPIAVPVEGSQIATDLDSLRDSFYRDYQRTFGHEMDEAIEIVSIRATLRTPLPRRATEREVGGAAPDERMPVSVQAYSFTKDSWLDFAILERATLGAGTRFSGPAILLEETATSYLDAGFAAEVHASGSILVTDTMEAV